MPFNEHRVWCEWLASSKNPTPPFHWQAAPPGTTSRCLRSTTGQPPHQPWVGSRRTEDTSALWDVQRAAVIIRLLAKGKVTLRYREKKNPNIIRLRLLWADDLPAVCWTVTSVRTINWRCLTPRWAAGEQHRGCHLLQQRDCWGAGRSSQKGGLCWAAGGSAPGLHPRALLLLLPRTQSSLRLWK